MVEIRAYRGHIRNWKALCGELHIENAEALTREEREERILKCA